MALGGIRSWLGTKLVKAGLRFLGEGSGTPARELEPTAGAPDEDDQDAAPFPPVALTVEARQMIADGLVPMHFPPPPAPDEPLRGSATDRIAKARAKYEMG